MIDPFHLWLWPLGPKEHSLRQILFVWQNIRRILLLIWCTLCHWNEAKIWSLFNSKEMHLQYFMNSKITVMFQVPWNLLHLSKHNPTTTHILRMGKEKWWLGRRKLTKGYAFYCNLCALLWNNLPFSLMFQIGQGQTVLTVLIQTENIFNSRVYTDKREKSNYLPSSIPLFTKGFCWVLGIFLLWYYSTSV